MKIVEEGTGKSFEMAVRYGKELTAPPLMMPSGWAAFLYLYQLR